MVGHAAAERIGGNDLRAILYGDRADFPGGTIEQGLSVCTVHQAVVGGIDRVALGHCDLRQILRRGVIEAGQIQKDCRDRRAKLGQTCRQIDPLQSLADPERLISDGGHALRDIQHLQTIALVKCPCADGFQLTVQITGKGDSLQAIAGVERIVANGDYAGGNLNFTQLAVSAERTCTDGNQGVRQGDFRQLRTVCEGTGTDLLQLASLGKDYLGQRAALKGAGSNLGDRGGNGDLLQIDAAFALLAGRKRSLADFCNALGNDNLTVRAVVGHKHSIFNFKVRIDGLTAF